MFKGYNDSEDMRMIRKEQSKEEREEFKEHQKVLKKVHEANIMKFLMVRPDVVVPTNRPVHPFPDLNTYVP